MVSAAWHLNFFHGLNTVCIDCKVNDPAVSVLMFWQWNQSALIFFHFYSLDPESYSWCGRAAYMKTE